MTKKLVVVGRRGIAVVAGAIFLTTGCSPEATETPVEKLTRVGQATSADFTIFKSEGGLDANSSWKGFEAVSVNPHFDNAGKLFAVQLLLAPTAQTKLTIDNVRDALTKECGTQWAPVPGSTGAIRTGDTSSGACVLVFNPSNGNVQVTLTSPQNQGSTSAQVGAAPAAAAQAAPSNEGAPQQSASAPRVLKYKDDSHYVLSGVLQESPGDTPFLLKLDTPVLIESKELVDGKLESGPSDGRDLSELGYEPENGTLIPPLGVKSDFKVKLVCAKVACWVDTLELASR